MDSVYAVVDSGVVTNIVIWDGESDWLPPDGATAILLSDDQFTEIGYLYDGNSFAAPQAGA